ncbi:helix-turn-helix domain-containing protein [Kocuria sp. cx-116]|nr:helix-turn-helix domain-containing protein [Kocuria sp. cx-116]
MAHPGPRLREPCVRGGEHRPPHGSRRRTVSECLSRLLGSVRAKRSGGSHGQSGHPDRAGAGGYAPGRHLRRGARARTSSRRVGGVPTDRLRDGDVLARRRRVVDSTAARRHPQISSFGPHSAATFELNGQPVVEYPIATGDRIHGFLAMGPGRALTAADRQVILTVCTLLAIKAKQREVASNATGTLAASVAKLLLHGQPEAARMLSEDLGLQDLPSRVRLLGLRMQPGDDVALLVRAAPSLRREAELPELDSTLTSCLLRHEEAGAVYLVLPATPARRTSDAFPTPLADAPGELVGALSEPVSLSEVAATVPPVRQALRHAPAGSLVSTGGGHDEQAHKWVDTLAAYPRADLVGTVTEYLRHRGNWENASRSLGVHRNSVRHRIGVAQSLLGVDLDDPDVFAPLWLALRGHGTHGDTHRGPDPQEHHAAHPDASHRGQ